MIQLNNLQKINSINTKRMSLLLLIHILIYISIHIPTSSSFQKVSFYEQQCCYYIILKNMVFEHPLTYSLKYDLENLTENCCFNLP